MSDFIDDDEEDFDDIVYETEEEVSWNCRIGKVVYKDHKLVQFPHTLRPSKERQLVIEQVVTMLDTAPENFDGWVVLGWNATKNGVYISWDSGSIPYDCLPEFVKEKLRKAIEVEEFI